MRVVPDTDEESESESESDSKSDSDDIKEIKEISSEKPIENMSSSSSKSAGSGSSSSSSTTSSSDDDEEDDDDDDRHYTDALTFPQRKKIKLDVPVVSRNDACLRQGRLQRTEYSQVLFR